MSGLKKKVRLKSNSVNAKHITPIVDETNDMNIGSISASIACSTRSTLDLILFDARIQRETVWTEYSTAKPTDKTNDIIENPVKFTPIRLEMPTTGTSVNMIVMRISKDPTRLATNAFPAEHN